MLCLQLDWSFPDNSVILYLLYTVIFIVVVDGGKGAVSETIVTG